MVKKILIGILFVFGWFGLVIGASSPAYYYFLGKNWVKPYDYYGDVYRFSNLAQFKKVSEDCKRLFYYKKKEEKQPVNLYSIGDSFLELWRINEHDLDYQNYQSIHWYQEKHQIKLDTTKPNILLIECSERHTRERFGVVPHNYRPVKEYDDNGLTPKNRWQQIVKIWNDLKPKFFTKETPDHLEHFFFANDFILPIKEAKAKMNLEVFDRVNPTAAISNDRKHLFYFMDKDTTLINSSFSSLSDSELDKMVANMDSTVKAYKAAGFDHVLINIIPSKMSIVSPEDGKYNHLVERFEAKAKGRFPIVSIYHEYAADRYGVYETNETHWTCKGKQIWLDKVNKGIKDALANP